MADTTVHGLLLAAGRSTRFGDDKLRAPLPDGPYRGLPLAIGALRAMRKALTEVYVVMRPNAVELQAQFEREHARVVIATHAARGMGSSLAAGVAAIPAGRAIVVALADMPWIDPSTIARVAQALRDGASIAAPRYRGERGHPVGFSPAHREALLVLAGDEGAHEILAAHRDALVLLDVEDPGVLRDVDRPADLLQPE